ncbi:hypothetical protein BV22DRAFT_1036052 [Leucogyrophana mollusca]|uniref:Uncharacterized protein n=1 Tax=Leucogyrophana mollusca TaxID=85980 RepID=A0ACB8BEW6_9AGAM|nr:hypothetical protein BV22DRAFT_1036052 [Leucogyrophana mollusca]
MTDAAPSYTIRSQSEPPTDTAGFDDELPPAYSASPDYFSGESTVEVGPGRAQPSYSIGSLDPLWSPAHSIPLVARSEQNPSNPSSGGRSGDRHGSSAGVIGSLFAAVRGVSNAPEAQQATRSSFAPPRPRAASASTPQVPQPSDDIPDDGRPTAIPVPGHPLLRNGKFLVYPSEFVCTKCRNTGYRNYHPSNPCKKCWGNYGRPFTGTLANIPDISRQRALPIITPLRTSS